MAAEAMMGVAHKTHGMGEERVEPDWQPLTLAEVRVLLSRFPDLGKPVEILSMSPRPFSAASVVRTTSGKAFIKRHHRAVRDCEGLREEHRFMEYLRTHGALVPRVFTSIKGETSIAIGDSTYEVHEAPDCIDIYEDALSWTPFQSVAHAHSAGVALARLHRAAEGFDAPRRKPHPLVASFTIFASDDPLEEAKRYFAARPALAASEGAANCTKDAIELLAAFHAELLPLLPELPSWWTHNDLHASNLLWSDGGDEAKVAAMIDFGLSDRTCAVHDLAHAIERNIVEWIALGRNRNHPEVVPVHLDHLHALLDGYESVRPLSAAEAATLAPMTALCHVEFALSEADYFLGILHSKEKARMAYYGWMVKHARWFLGSEGRVLLDAIRQRCRTGMRQGKVAP
jgi:Ser/Thr protein kinase RdoA (MazF antagonist)